MDVSIQTDHVDPQELLNVLIQQHMEQEKLQRQGGSEETSPGLTKHHQQQQDPDAIHPLSDAGEISRSEQNHALHRSPKIKPKHHPTRISFARDSKKRSSHKQTKSSSGNSDNCNRGKHSCEQSSLSDRICQVVWSRKESAPFVTPLSSKRLGHHSSARRGTAPNVPLMRHNFESKPDAFGGRSQSFKGSSSSGSVKKRIAACRDSLSRRASGDPVPYLEASSVAYRTLYPLKPKSKVGRHCVGVCNCSGEISIENGNESHRKNCRVVFGQNFDSPQSSAAGSGQNLSSSLSSPQDPFERKMGGLLVHHGGSGKSRCSSHDGDVDRIMKRQTSMTLSIPSREDSIRSCSSSKSYGSHSTNALPTTSYSPVLPCTSSTVTNGFSATRNITATTSKVAEGHGKPSMGKLVRYGSNPDVSPSRRTKWKQGEQETLTLHQQTNRGRIGTSNRSLTVGSNYNIDAIFSGSGRVSSANSFTNLEDKKKQILSEKHKRNEKVAWVVHLCFSSLLILAITCIVVFLRLSSTMTSTLSSSSFYPNSSVFPLQNESSPVSSRNETFFGYEDDEDDNNSTMRKENENLLQSIQPQLNLNNITTPQPSTHTQQVDDNISGNDDSGQISDKSMPNLQSGQPLTRIRTKEELILPSSSSSDNAQSEDEDGQPKSNNETAHENLNIMSSTERREEEVERGGSIDRSNNASSKVAFSSSSSNNPSIKTNSIRPKRSRPKPKPGEIGGGGGVDDMPSTRNSNIIISMLNEKVHTNAISDTPSSLMKARHLESTIIRFLKNSSSSSATRERRNPGLESRKL